MLSRQPLPGSVTSPAASQTFLLVDDLCAVFFCNFLFENFAVRDLKKPASISMYVFRLILPPHVEITRTISLELLWSSFTRLSIKKIINYNP